MSPSDAASKCARTRSSKERPQAEVNRCCTPRTPDVLTHSSEGANAHVTTGNSWSWGEGHRCQKGQNLSASGTQHNASR